MVWLIHLSYLSQLQELLSSSITPCTVMETITAWICEVYYSHNMNCHGNPNGVIDNVCQTDILLNYQRQMQGSQSPLIHTMLCHGHPNGVLDIRLNYQRQCTANYNNYICRSWKCSPWVLHTRRRKQPHFAL